jgi:hypothetical protein
LLRMLETLNRMVAESSTSMIVLIAPLFLQIIDDDLNWIGPLALWISNKTYALRLFGFCASVETAENCGNYVVHREVFSLSARHKVR